MSNILRFIILALFFTSYSHAQVKVGQWVDHLSYRKANSVSKVGNIVYFSNGSGVAKYNEDDNSVERFTKIDGLSDVGVKLLRKNNYNNILLVIYNNANIDVVKPNGEIVNVSDLKRKIITGKKVINEVYFNANLAYIACGFGIVVFDTDKLEIKDTYVVGNAINGLEINEVTKNDTAVFVATPSGIYFGKVTTNLSYYLNWKPLNTGIPAGEYNSIVLFNGKILANFSNPTPAFDDVIYQYDGTSWTVYPYKTGTTNKKIYDYSQYNKIIINDQWGSQVINADGTSPNYTANYGFDAASINDIFYENDLKLWYADARYGLIKSSGFPPYPNEAIAINAPNINIVNDLDCLDGNLYSAATYLGDEWNNQWNFPYLNNYTDGSWQSISNSAIDTIQDVNCVAIDPNDKTHVVFGSWGKGVIELKNNALVKIHNTANSSLTAAFGSAYDARIGGVCFDANSNMWAVASLNNKFLNVKLKSGIWKNFDFTTVASANPNAIMTTNPNATKVIVDKNNQVWVQLSRGGGMLIFKPDASYSAPNTSNAKVVSSTQGSGNLPSLDVFSMAEDKDGKIWVGTSKGIAVFYNPENVFKSGANWDCSQILIEQDKHVQILLENDVITAIAVDGVNRKWIGTQSSGVYCFSSDGQTQIYHFTEDSSPLYSNIIRDISIDEISGDVFIGSAEGIQSFRTSIIKGFENFKDVHAFPNPIKPGFNGLVYVTGLIDEASVKITDVAGNLVWETKSQGGRIEWNLNTFSGTRVASGVYMIYCASADGGKSATAKLLVIN